MKLGLFCPGSPPPAERLERGLDWLRRRGFELTPGATVVPGSGLHAGPPAARARDLMDLLTNPALEAVLCVRGGSGTLGLLPHLDYERLRENEKPVIGMSDVTALHLALWKACGWLGISGPMVVQLSPDTPSYTVDRWLALVRGPTLAGEVPLPPGADPKAVTPDDRFSWTDIPSRPTDVAPPSSSTSNQGSTPRASDSAVGPVLPCNLSLLAAMIGTPFLPDLTGAILVLEDIHETPQSLDRMVAQLQLSGATNGLGGLVLGQFTDCVPRGPGVTEEDGRALLLEWAAGLGIPAISGFPYGHEPLTCSLPFGARARLHVNPPRLELLRR